MVCCVWLMSTIPFPTSIACIPTALYAMQRCSTHVVCTHAASCCMCENQNLLLLDSSVQTVARARVHLYMPGSVRCAVFKHPSPRQFQSGEFSGDGGTDGTTTPPSSHTLHACFCSSFFASCLYAVCVGIYCIYVVALVLYR